MANNVPAYLSRLPKKFNLLAENCFSDFSKNNYGQFVFRKLLDALLFYIK